MQSTGAILGAQKKWKGFETPFQVFATRKYAINMFSETT